MLYSGYTIFFNQYVCSLGIEPTTICTANANALPLSHRNTFIIYLHITFLIYFTTKCIAPSMLNKTIHIVSAIIYQGSRVRPIWSHVHPNFSRVRLTKIPGRTGASSHSRKEKKSIRDSETLWFNKRHPR